MARENFNPTSTQKINNHHRKDISKLFRKKQYNTPYLQCEYCNTKKILCYAQTV